MSRRDEFIQVAGTVPFDNDTNGFTAEDVQAAIEEIASGGGTGSSPGLQFTRSGNVVSGSFLQVGSVPSNTAGSPVGLTSAKIIAVVVTNELINTFTVKVEEHDGTTFTTLGTYSLTAERYKAFIALNVAVGSGKELAVSISSGSCKNVVVNVYVTGNTV